MKWLARDCLQGFIHIWPFTKGIFRGTLIDIHSRELENKIYFIKGVKTDPRLRIDPRGSPRILMNFIWILVDTNVTWDCLSLLAKLLNEIEWNFDSLWLLDLLSSPPLYFIRWWNTWLLICLILLLYLIYDD